MQLPDNIIITSGGIPTQVSNLTLIKSTIDTFYELFGDITLSELRYYLSHAESPNGNFLPPSR